MNFLIEFFKKIFNKNKVKYIVAPVDSKEKNIDKPKTINNYDKNEFRTHLIYQADPDINDGDGYKIKKVNLKDMM